MTKLRLDMADLTLGELAQVADLLGVSLQDALTGTAQPRAIAAIACVVKQRDDPGFTFDQALELKMSDIEVVNADPDAEGEAPAASNGGERAPSPVSGV